MLRNMGLECMMTILCISTSSLDMGTSTSSEICIFENLDFLELTTTWKTTNGRRWISRQTFQRISLRQPILLQLETIQNSSVLECMWLCFQTSTQEIISLKMFRRSKNMKRLIQEFDHEWSYVMYYELLNQEEMSYEIPWTRCLSKSRRASSSLRKSLKPNFRKKFSQSQSEKWKMNFLSLRLKMSIPLLQSQKIKYIQDNKFTTDKRWWKLWTSLLESQRRSRSRQRVSQWKLKKL